MGVLPPSVRACVTESQDRNHHFMMTHTDKKIKQREIVQKMFPCRHLGNIAAGRLEGGQSTMIILTGENRHQNDLKMR